MGSGVSGLAQAIDERIRQRTRRPDSLELGTIQADMSLLVDRFPVPIPAGDYLMASGLAGGLQAGDRILVGWANDGTDPVVLCKVVSS